MSGKILGILEYALSKEMEGMNFYESKARTVHNEEVKKTFLELGKMESDHVDYINGLINKVNEDEPLRYKGEEIGDAFRDRQKQEIVNQGDFKKLKTDIPVLRMAYLIEQDFMEFYNKAAESVEEKEIKEILRHLAEWEKVHRDRIYDLYQKLSKDFWEHMETDPIF